MPSGSTARVSKQKEASILSEPRIISPLLDGFALGQSMSCHSGVSCYPAMRVDSDERYIVKTISIPASQTQLEALLITGAYPNAEAARAYYLELARGIEQEAEILEKLSRQRGFLPFAGCQTVPMEKEVGYQVYLVSPYRRSLERCLRRSPLTHLSAVNMGIDLCAALSVAREAGYLYVDLKPGNISLSGEQTYHISDLGFIALDSLKYASLPQRLRSAYTAPEVTDAMAQLNTTLDTYALGLVLYQVYNNNTLPNPDEPLAAPAYADYEMAQIILRAIDPDPQARWADPNEMGRALIAYMQRNGANDVPIGPPPSCVAEEEPTEQEELEEAAQAGDETVAEPEAQEDWVDSLDALRAEDGQEESQEVVAQLHQILSDSETEDEPVDADQVSRETADILQQVDELIAHEVPEPAVAPEAIDVPTPAPIVLEEEEPEQTAPSEEAQAEKAGEETGEPDETQAASDEDEADEEEYDEDDDEDEEDDRPRGGFLKRLLTAVLIVALLAGVVAGGWWFVTRYYLQQIDDLSITGAGSSMTVNVSTDLDESLLTVVCVDLYGNKQTMPLSGGSAVFTDLTPDTQYNLSLEVEGLHRLTGKTTAQFYTLPQANITSFTALTGPEDGSVILKFTGEGPAVDSWNVEYTAEGLTPVRTGFTGTTVTISGLTPGTAYTFTLVPSEDMELVGQTQLAHVASKVIYAQNLALTGDGASTITATWDAPEDASVDSWTARCYNEAGYDQTITVTDTTATFTDIDAGVEHTVEITAQGMTQSTRTYVTANPISVTKIDTGSFNGSSISVTWEFSGNAPEGGWLLLYTMDNAAEQHVVQCAANAAVIEPAVPGCHYDITIQAANAVSVFGGTAQVDIPEADSLSQYGLTADQINASVCKAPAEGEWDYTDIDDADVTDTLQIGDSAGILLHTTEKYDIEYETIPVLFVVRDADGKVVSVDQVDRTWDDLWYKGHCDLSVPRLPSAVGSYTLSLYINKQLVTTLSFTMEQAQE